ncbi:MAG: hypothetical protein C5B50_07765 [Verrucomicrobia bacterium]|nr:MAG: hypothetical protein C5B50_07765 [Verrucomicrobiota bacterium]
MFFVPLLRAVRCFGAPLVILFTPKVLRLDTAVGKLLVTWFAFTWIPYSLIRPSAIFWPFFCVYAALNLGAIVVVLIGWMTYSNRWGWEDIIPGLLLLNAALQPVSVLLLRHFRTAAAKRVELKTEPS